jgi:putative colanic acid biosynthesis UDP-glucose lipid carrier transferase
MALTVIVIKFDSKGPIFFRQERLGLKGKAFKIMKFRTMIPGAENNGPVWTDHNDPRITRAGKFIRKLRLDELPQLWNIIRGEMSFIGPRPLAHTSYMDTIDFYRYRTLVKPGITGWAQVNGFRGGDDLEHMRSRIECDLEYLRNWSLGLDLQIILRTVVLVFRDVRAF